MSATSPDRALEARLKDVDARLRRRPGSVELKFERARLLDQLRRNDAAKKAYLEVLTLAPKHFGAMNDLAMLLYTNGQPKEGFLLYAEAVERHPENPVAHANLAYMFLKADEPQRARHHYETALRLDPGNTEAQRGFVSVLTQLGETAAAASLVEAGAAPSMSRLPFRGSGRPIPVLLLVSVGAGNVDAERLIDNRTFQTTKLAVELHDPATPLPPHRVIFNAIGDADVCAPALAAALRVIPSSNAPILNSPERVLPTGRAANAARLRALTDVVTPQVAQLSRHALLAPDAQATLAAAGLHFPLLIRALGYHTGQHFLRVERVVDLADAVAELPGDELLAIEFLDTADVDGQHRKYRVMRIDGALYPVHVAISPEWKVHYFSADMADRVANRAEDAAFLGDMPAVLGARTLETLNAIFASVNLDYAGIDFALDRDGKVVVFEANATMVLTRPSDDERFEYRRAPIERAFDAVRTMLLNKALSGSHRI